MLRHAVVANVSIHLYYVLMNKQTKKYKVTFIGTNGEKYIFVESPLAVDCDHEDNVNDIIDISIEIANLKFGENFRDELDTYGISLELAE